MKHGIGFLTAPVVVIEDIRALRKDGKARVSPIVLLGLGLWTLLAHLAITQTGTSGAGFGQTQRSVGVLWDLVALFAVFVLPLMCVAALRLRPVDEPFGTLSDALRTMMPRLRAPVRVFSTVLTFSLLLAVIIAIFLGDVRALGPMLRFVLRPALYLAGSAVFYAAIAFGTVCGSKDAEDVLTETYGIIVVMTAWPLLMSVDFDPQKFNWGFGMTLNPTYACSIGGMAAPILDTDLISLFVALTVLLTAVAIRIRGAIESLMLFQRVQIVLLLMGGGVSFGLSIIRGWHMACDIIDASDRLLAYAFPLMAALFLCAPRRAWADMEKEGEEVCLQNTSHFANVRGLFVMLLGMAAAMTIICLIAVDGMCDKGVSLEAYWHAVMTQPFVWTPLPLSLIEVEGLVYMFWAVARFSFRVVQNVENAQCYSIMGFALCATLIYVGVPWLHNMWQDRFGGIESVAWHRYVAGVAIPQEVFGCEIFKGLFALVLGTVFLLGSCLVKAKQERTLSD